MKTFVKRYFESQELLQDSIKAFNDSGFFSKHDVKNVGNYFVLHGEGTIDLYTMRTKFPDALKAD